MFSRKEIANFYFVELETTGNSSNHQCKCGSKPLKQDKTNLIQNVHRVHPDWKKEMKTAMTAKSFDFALNQKTKDIYQRLDWVIMEGLPFNFVEKVRTLENTKLDRISTKRLVKLIENLIPLVENEVAKVFPDKIGLIIDGWSDGSTSTHFFAI